MKQNKIGLVLAGGAAKGAYQVGVLKCLNELGFEPDIIAGTSIGALNGGFLASSDNFSDAVKNLESIWKELGKKDIIKIDKVNVTTAVISTVLSFKGSKLISKKILPLIKKIEKLLPLLPLSKEFCLFNIDPIEELIKENISENKIKNGKELWVTVYPVLGMTDFILPNLLISKLLKDVHYYHINSLNEEKIHEVLLASAAIPFAFPSRSYDGNTLVDGGLGDNVPLKALESKGCDKVVVIHLTTNSTWNRHNFKNMTIIEIRPEEEIEDIGQIKSLLDFSENRIMDLIQRGYKDTINQLQSIQNLLQPVQELRKNIANMRITSDEIENLYL